jgi:hypothetical protein
MRIRFNVGITRESMAELKAIDYKWDEIKDGK